MSDPTPQSSPRIRNPRGSLVVAIDGPAASGKSSTAQWVAQRLGFRHVDSGALYRAATAVTLAHAGVQFDESTVLSSVGEISLLPTENSFAPMWKGENMEELIRAPEVTRLVSRVAQMRGVRDWVDANVRKAAEGRDVVVDGRDIGTVVFPDADLKVFLIADPWERARRRLTQRHGRAPTDAEIAEETERLVQRDARDATQTVQAKDAILIDTTYLTQAEQVERIVSLAGIFRGDGAADGAAPQT
ncbi:MAG TPA: (d)CMP kinase [Gemmatimonadaceae bacterium]|nr:(d)CMP kinase [Gemmatimonadaceae bacterium]